MVNLRKSLLSVVLLTVVVAGGFLVAPARVPAQTPATPSVVRLYFSSRDQLNAVAGQLDVWEVHFDAGYAVVAVKPAEYQWLQGQGYRLEVDAAKTAQMGIQAPLDPRFYYFDEYYPNSYGRYIAGFLQDTAFAYGNIAELIDIGQAWGASHGLHPRDMLVLRITNEDPAYGNIADKPVFFVFSNVHAREVATAEMSIRYIKYLTSGYNGQGGFGIDPDVTWLVNHNVLYDLVMVNPDGHYMNETNTGNFWRKNVDNLNGCNDPGSWGTDMNRNSSFKWGCCGGSTGQPCGETYRGPSRASEPEIQAFQTFLASVIPDQNGPNGDDEIPPASPDNAKDVFFSLHSYGDEILWPWAFGGQPPNAAQFTSIGHKMAYLSTYYPLQFLYTVDGDNGDWVYGKLGAAAVEVEMGPDYGSCGGFFPAYGCMEGTDGMPENFWNELRPTFLWLHKIARTPFITTFGPDTQTLAVTPNPVPQGTPVTLTGNVADHRYGGDPVTQIAAAEYFVDTEGQDGTGTAMAPSDGDWGQNSENVTASVPTGGLSVGQHYILVHGKGTNGKWGPFTAVFVNVTPGGCDPVHDAAFTWSPTSPFVGDLVTFNGTAAGTEPVTFAWTFGDGDTGNGATVTHTYDTAGTFTVSMTASNSCGQQVVQHSITVQPNPTGTLHLNALQLSKSSPRPGVYKIVAKARVHNELHQRMSGVTVSAQWTKPDGSTLNQQAVTNLLGVAKFAQKFRVAGTYQFCVTGMTKTGYVYNPAANEVPDCKTIAVP